MGTRSAAQVRAVLSRQKSYQLSFLNQVEIARVRLQLGNCDADKRDRISDNTIRDNGSTGGIRRMIS